MHILLLTLLLNAIIQQAYSQCHPHTGPANESDVCVHVDGYYEEQCAKCRTTTEYRSIRPQCTNNKNCLDPTRNYCYYTCMLEHYDRSSGPVYNYCKCRQNLVKRECHSPTGKDCEWYNECLEKQHPCDDTDNPYAIGYAYKYCTAYEKNYANFSITGQKWIDDARLCLQNALVELLNPCIRVSCSDIERLAFHSHIKCYTSPTSDSSVCFLPISDMIQIIKTVSPAFAYNRKSTMTFLRTYLNAITTAIACAGKYDLALETAIQSLILTVLFKIYRPFSEHPVEAHLELDIIKGITTKLQQLNTGSHFKFLKNNPSKTRIDREKRSFFYEEPISSRRDNLELYIIDTHWPNDITIPPNSTYPASLVDLSNILKNLTKFGLLEFNITGDFYYIEEMSYCYGIDCVNTTNIISAPPFRRMKSFKAILKQVVYGVLILIFICCCCCCCCCGWLSCLSE